jgi:hypothetical protein
MRTFFIRSAAIGAALFLGLSSAGAAMQSRTAEFGRDAVIPFANGDGIRDWYAPNPRVIYLMDRTNRWYRATLSAPCQGLRFNQAVAFDTDPLGTFDTFSRIITRDNVCHIDRLVRAPRPAAKGGKGLD